MLLLMMLFFPIVLVFGLVRLLFGMAWGATKVLLMLALFCISPVLFIVLIAAGLLATFWLPALIIGLALGVVFRRRPV